MFSYITPRRTPLTFRHFNRKGYALFACLGREVRIGVLGAATLATAAPCLAASSVATVPTDSTEVDSTDSATLLSEAVVQTARAPLAANLAARQVVTLSQRELAAAGITSVNDLLKLASNIDVRQRGGFGIQTDISVDGGTFDQLTLLVNGAAVTNPQTGHNAADFPLNISDIERVEVLAGAASRVFGSQAFSGAVNIVTRSGGSPFSASIEGGSYGTLLASARTALHLNRFATTLSAGYRRSDGAVKNGAFEGVKAYWSGRYTSPSFSLFSQAGVTANDFGANTFYSGAYPDQWEATRRYLVSVSGESRGRIHLAPQVVWMRNVDHYQLIHGSSKGENFNRSDVFTLTLNAWTQWELGRTAVGAEMRSEALFSTNLGRPLDASQQFRVPGQDSVYFSRHDQRTNTSFFLEHNVLLPRLTISFGIMAQRNTSASRRFSFYPGIDVSFRPTETWRLFASLNRSMRLPTFTDLYYKSPTQEGNVGLRPEECTALRLGAEWKHNGIHLNADAHFTRGNNMIDWIMRTSDDIYHATSFDLDNIGATISARLDLTHLLGESQPLKSLSASYAYLYQHRRRGEPYFKSNYALEYLRHKFTALLSHRIFSHLEATWTLRLQQRRGAYQVYENATPTDVLRPYGTNALLDLRLTWSAPHYTLHLDLNNLTSHRYYDLANVRQPGFTLLAGATFTL